MKNSKRIIEKKLLTREQAQLYDNWSRSSCGKPKGSIVDMGNYSYRVFDVSLSWDIYEVWYESWYNTKPALSMGWYSYQIINGEYKWWHNNNLSYVKVLLHDFFCDWKPKMIVHRFYWNHFGSDRRTIIARIIYSVSLFRRWI
jgi:hypothetical protein